MSKSDFYRAAKKNKNDEYYTPIEVIEKEIPYYKEYLKDKWVYCPCDDYRKSNFVIYLKEHFNELGLERLTATNYDIGDGAWHYVFDGVNEWVGKIEDGDFRSHYVQLVRSTADVIITNPPFSLLREFYTDFLADRDFLIIAPNSVFYYKVTAPGFVADDLRIGVSGELPSAAMGISNAIWMTNMKVPEQQPKPLTLTQRYTPGRYPKFTKIDAINVDVCKDIPMDYDGVMGVPITFYKWLNRDEWEVYGATDKTQLPDGTKKFKRLLIKRKK